jgi:hypothetical protein
MARTSKEFQAFDRLTDQLLSVPKEVLDRRVAAHKAQAELNPKKRGPKRKVTEPSDVSRDPVAE